MGKKTKLTQDDVDQAYREMAELVRRVVGDVLERYGFEPREKVPYWRQLFIGHMDHDKVDMVMHVLDASPLYRPVTGERYRITVEVLEHG